jgi:pSer/pThr/pTyr-binding forkhead associated (FHA) protein
LSGYVESGVHQVQVHVVDNLGISGMSIVNQVRVDVNLPRRTVWTMISQNGELLAGLVVLFSGAVLFMVFVMSGRINPSRINRSRKKKSQMVNQSQPTVPLKVKQSSQRDNRTDPLTQPVKGADAKQDENPRRLPQWMNRLHWPQRPVPTAAFAYLSRITENEQGGGAAPFPLSTNLVSIGRDSYQATLVFDDPSIDALHARMEKDKHTYRLSDANSIAGTWVNYSPVSQEGTLLEHGDLIHIGRVGFRFTLREPTRSRKPVITPKEPPS